jgi:CheY-like chemotaxis protein
MAEAAPNPRCRTILIVEDDAAIRTALQLALEMEGYSVKTASQGQEALELLPRMDTPCLILLDLMMPIMNGWEFARALRQDMVLAPIPVALVTAYSEEASQFQGAQALIKKPVDLELLYQVVRKFCG